MTLLLPQWLWLYVFWGIYLLYRRKRGGGLVLNTRSVMLSVAFILAVAALCRPVLPREPVEIERRGSDVIFAVDLSRSMQATDIAPSRLEAAKALLASTVRGDENNRFGVIAFTTNPIILSPLTRDDELLLHLFSGLDPSLVMTRGTNISEALKLAGKLSRSEHPIVVLLTDGGDELGYEQEAAWAKARGLVVDVVLLATAGGGTLKTEDGRLLRDEEGGIVVTARNGAIKRLAEATNGVVIEGNDAAALAAAVAKQGEKAEKSKTKVVLYRELFYYPLAAALLFAMLGMTDLIPRMRRRYA